jgi:WD40 repeat protein
LAIGPYLTTGIELWDVDHGARVRTFSVDTGELRIRFDSTGERLLAYDAWAGSLSILDTSSGETELACTGVVMFAISADETGGFRLLQSLADGQLVAVAVDLPRIYHSLPLVQSTGSGTSPNDLVFSADGHLLGVVNRGELFIFDTQKYLQLDRLNCGQCFIQFDRDGSLLTSSTAGLARWGLSKDVKPGEELQKAPLPVQLKFGPPAYLSSTAAYAQFSLSSDGSFMVIPTGDEVQLQFPFQPDQSRTMGPHPDIRRVSISPNGKRVVTGGWAGGKACIWEIASGNLLHTIDEPDCCNAQFSPDGKWLVTNANRVRIWDAETWALARDFDVLGSSVSGVQVCFSPDSRVLAISDATARINLFDPETGLRIAVLTDPNQHQATLMVFNPNGSQLAVLSQTPGTVVHVWDLTAIREELRKRDMDWSSPDFMTVNSTPAAERIGMELEWKPGVTNLHFVPDRRFVEIEAAQQFESLRSSAERYDIQTARTAIARIIRLQPRRAITCNGVAWILANGPQPLRDSKIAVEFARHAIADDSLSEADRANFFNTLGVALYRDSKILEAIEVLEQSLALQPVEAQPFDLYFLSMCHSRIGASSTARDFFDRAESLFAQTKSDLPIEWQAELIQFAQEACMLLGDAGELNPGEN